MNAGPVEEIRGRISLPSVTIVSVNGRDPERSVAAIRHSCRNLEFARRLLITNRPMEEDGIVVQVERGLSSLTDYNRFCLLELHERIETDFCLIVQPDGFVVHSRLWTDFFLQYDYIGAPWDQLRSMEALKKSGHHPTSIPSPIVGNGGFSLRSRKLLHTVASLKPSTDHIAEDCVISAQLRDQLKESGIRFAPLRLAQQFSLERMVDQFSMIGNHFGFHGRFAYFDHYLAITEAKIH